MPALVTRSAGAELVEGPRAPSGLVPPPPLPEPARLPRRVVHETGRRKRVHRSGGDRQPIRVGGRLAFGALGRVSGPLPVRAAFGLDVLAVARMPLTRGRVALGLLPEFGYSLLAGAHKTRGNFLNAGMGLGVIAGPVVFGVIPRVVTGALEHTPQIPVAEALRQWLQPPSCNGGLGQLCRGYALWPRPQLGGEAPLELAVSVAVGGRGDAAILYRLAIPPGALEGGLGTMFGDRQRTLDELHRRHGRARVVIHPLHVLAAGPRGGFTHASRALLQQRVLGTRRRPGLRAHPGLRFRVYPDRLPTPDGQPGSAQVAELRLLLLSLGVSAQQIEVIAQGSGTGPEGGLQVQYELPLAPLRPGA